MLIILFVFLTGPFLCGELVCSVISRKRKGSFLSSYPIGLLAVLCIFAATVFLALKLEWNLYELKDWFLRLLGGTELAGLGVFSFDFFKNRLAAKENRTSDFKKPDFNSSMLFFIVPAVLLALECFFLLAPSYANNDTAERVQTALFSGELYKFAPLTGCEMTAGLPIWGKIQIMPLFYAVIADASNVSPYVFMKYVVPLLLYVINISIMWEVSRCLMPRASMRRRSTFMCAYLCVLYAGTYISDYGIVTTTGYALLREGYAGYAFCFALIFPLFFLYILEKKYLPALFTLIPVAGLIRVDIYAILFLKDAVNVFHVVNESGKLAGIWLIAVIILALLKLEKKISFKPVMLLCPAATIAYAVENLGHTITGSKKQFAYYLGAGCIIFASCGFLMCDDAISATEEKRTDNKIRECIEIARLELGDAPMVLYSSKDVMAKARRIDGSVRVIYGRNVYQPMMSAYDFESMGENISDYIYYSQDWVEDYDCYTLSCEIPELINRAVSEGVNVIIVCNPARPDDTGAQFESQGFVKTASTAEYMIFTKH